MKRLLLVFAAIAITAGAYAQIDSTNRNMSPQDMKNKQNLNVQNNPVDKSQSDGVIMQNGKIMMVKNGKTTLLDHDMTMSNGTKIMSNGTYIDKDGKKMALKEGQRMNGAGNIILVKNNKDKNMYLVPDSTRKKGN